MVLCWRRHGRAGGCQIIWGCSSVGRAPALQAGGQEFESLHLHLIIQRAAAGLAGKLFRACSKKSRPDKPDRIFEEYPERGKLVFRVLRLRSSEKHQETKLFIPELLTNHYQTWLCIRMYLENRIQKRKFFLKYLRERHPRRLPRGNHKT